MALRGASVAPLESGFIDAVRDVLRSLGLTDEPPQAGGALRDAWEARAAILRLAEESPGGDDAARLHRRAAGEGEGSARARHADGHPRDPARGEGTRVGPRAPSRRRRGPAADQLRDDVRAGRRRAAAGLRRHHAGRANAVDVVVARNAGAAAVAVPARDRHRHSACGRWARIERCSESARSVSEWQRGALPPGLADQPRGHERRLDHHRAGSPPARAARAAARPGAARPGRHRGGARRGTRGTACVRARTNGPTSAPDAGEHEWDVRDVAAHQRGDAPRLDDMVRQHDHGTRSPRLVPPALRTR